MQCIVSDQLVSRFVFEPFLVFKDTMKTSNRLIIMIGSRKGWIDTPEDCGGQIFPATMTLLLRMVARANGSEGRYARYREVFPVNHREPASKQPRRRWLLIIRPCPCQLINNKCTPPPQTDLQRPWQRERVLFCKNLKLGIRPTEKFLSK